ncbi:MAG: four helix bundle protein [Phycisphaerae bacterium]
MRILLILILRVSWGEDSFQLSVISCQLSGGGALQGFRDLKVWQKGHVLTLDVYRATTRFPSSELYGLTSQMRRSAASIGANIAEGCCRETGVDFARFLQMAMGSASELEYHILLARDLNLLPAEPFSELTTAVTEVKRMLASLIPKVRGSKQTRERNSHRQLTTDN